MKILVSDVYRVSAGLRTSCALHNMRRILIVQFVLIFLLLAVTTEGFFFEYPKKALMDFLQSLKQKKEAKKKEKENNVHHYHLHYYPAPIQVVSGMAAKAPDKHSLDEIHSEHLRSLGWSDYEYKYVPEPKITMSSSVHELWDDGRGPWSWNQDTIETENHETFGSADHKGILVQIPLKQHIVIQHAKPHKSGLLASFFEKFTHSKNSVD